MRKIVQRLLSMFELLGLTALSALIVTIAVTLRHMLDTPQPLTSILPGEAGLYRWQHGHLFYKTLGDEHAPPLVLLHAPTIGASSYEMRKIAGALAQHYHVYALDLLGFGLSDRPQMSYTAETYMHMCHDFLTEVVGEPTTIVASELSCNYAVILAQRFPELCTRLVLFSPVWLFNEEKMPERWSRFLQEPNMARILYALVSTRTALRLALARQHSPVHDQVTASDVDYLYAATHQFGAEHAPVARLAGRLAINASAQFEQLQQPALIIWGARALNDTRHALSSQQHMPTQAQMALIQDAGLYVHEEYPASVVANIVQWSEQRSEPKADEQPIAYCVRCKKKTIMEDVEEVTMKNGRPAVRGKCSVCGAGQYRIGQI